MKLTYVKPIDSADKTPVSLLMKKPYFLCSTINLGETLEVEDEMGYAIMGDERYRGMFKVSGESKSMTASGTVQNKAAKAQATKSIRQQPVTAETDVGAI